MNPETVFLATLVLAFAAVLGVLKMGKIWLFGWVSLALVVSTVIAGKVVEVFGFAITIGMPLYASIFLATDVLTERYGKRAGYGAVIMGFGALLAFVVFAKLALLIPSVSYTQELNQAMTLVFDMSFRVALAALASYFVAQLLDVWVFDYLRTKTGEGLLWLRNNASTIATQFLDNAIFFFIAFYGILPNWFELVIVASVMRIAVSLLDTPFMYLAKRITPRELGHETMISTEQKGY